MPMSHVSLDIETMGNSSKAAVISVGACYFNPETSDIGETFHHQVNLQSSIDAGLEISGDTVIWWLKQDQEARSKFFNNESALPLCGVMTALSGFIKPGSEVWGNGVSFDNVILENAMKSVGVKVPWDFWNSRDLRTLVEVGKLLGVNPKEDLPFDGVRHDALSDAIHQAKITSFIWQKIMEVQDANKNEVDNRPL